MYLIDAANLGGVLGGAAGARDRAAVIRFLADWARGRGRVVALFDGIDDGQLALSYGNLRVEWSGAGRSADDAILTRVQRGTALLTVVTDDRELARRAREAGAKVLPARELVQRVEAPHPGPRATKDERRDAKPGESAAERAHWKKVFGVD